MGALQSYAINVSTKGHQWLHSVVVLKLLLQLRGGGGYMLKESRKTQSKACKVL